MVKNLDVSVTIQKKKKNNVVWPSQKRYMYSKKVCNVHVIHLLSNNRVLLPQQRWVLL